ncbi:b16.2 [Ichnoviriform fugitivi]|uniref:B16.2 n=1 Tax=Ichnoviriform fugitivi TaxID=265522 RepID=A2Q0F4_9VIRU|nr:b16.2 [Ichnoviriform fugitivi]BAF45669.1 b16.2 [Ichnoviriform fugitivi]
MLAVQYCARHRPYYKHRQFFHGLLKNHALSGECKAASEVAKRVQSLRRSCRLHLLPTFYMLDDLSICFIQLIQTHWNCNRQSWLPGFQYLLKNHALLGECKAASEVAKRVQSLRRSCRLHLLPTFYMLDNLSICCCYMLLMDTNPLELQSPEPFARVSIPIEQLCSISRVRVRKCRDYHLSIY